MEAYIRNRLSNAENTLERGVKTVKEAVANIDNPSEYNWSRLIIDIQWLSDMQTEVKLLKDMSVFMSLKKAIESLED